MIAYLSPHPRLRQFLMGFNSIVIFDCKEDLTWYLNNIKITSDFETEFNRNYSDYKKVIKMITESGPTISRHYDCLPEYEIEIRKIAFSVLGLAQVLRKNEIKLIIFPTVASHHLDSLILEFAARLVGAPQIFHALSLMSNRRFPVIQNNGIRDRVSLKYKISNYESAKNVPPSGKNSWRAPIISPAKRYSKTFGSLVAMLFLAKVRQNIGNLKDRVSAILEIPFTYNKKISQVLMAEMQIFPVKRIGVGKEINLALEHWRAINYYICVSKENESFINTYLSPRADNYNGPKFLAVAAHFQPEVSTFPEGGEFYNFIDVVMKIRSLGVKTPIIYKEHPAMFYLGARYEHKQFQSFRGGCARSIDYYKQLQHLGVYFVNKSFNLIDCERIIPITITGSIAIERSLLGLKTVVMGHPYFKGLPGLISLEAAVNLLDSTDTSCPNVSLSKKAQSFLTLMEDYVTFDYEALAEKFMDEDRISTLKIEYTSLIRSLERDFF